MSQETDLKPHKCSCGRSFRHAISLRRHKEVSGCTELPEAPPKEIVKLAAEVAAAEITVAPSVELRSSGPLERSVPLELPTPREPEVSWFEVCESCLEVFGQLHGCAQPLARLCSGTLGLLARLALLLAVVVSGGWLVLRGTPGEVAPRAYAQEAKQMAAEGVVEGFLENARLNQFQRAHYYLTPAAQASVSAAQLERMLGGLPLGQPAQRWNSEIVGDEARVVVTRGGAQEVYKLVHHNHNWGVASVAVLPVGS